MVVYKGYSIKGKQEKHILRNLFKELVDHTTIITTSKKAKSLKIYGDRLLSRISKGDLHNIRNVESEIHDRKIMNKLLDSISKYQGRTGGHISILKYGYRRGDNALMYIVKILD